MEVAGWALIMVVLMTVFKALKLKRTEAIYFEI